MVASNPNNRIPSNGSNPVPPGNRLAKRFGNFSDPHFELGHDIFFLQAGLQEINFQNYGKADNRERPRQVDGKGIKPQSTARSTLRAEDIRIHARLAERLVVLHYQRYGLWPRLRRLLLGNRLVRWLGLQPQRNGDV
jgi:hypothetical protein